MRTFGSELRVFDKKRQFFVWRLRAFADRGVLDGKLRVFGGELRVFGGNRRIWAGKLRFFRSELRVFERSSPVPDSQPALPGDRRSIAKHEAR